MNCVNKGYRLLSRQYSYTKQEYSYHWVGLNITYECKEDAEDARRIQTRDNWIAVVSNNNQRWKKPETYKD